MLVETAKLVSSLSELSREVSEGQEDEEMKDVSIVLPTRNNEDHIADLLESIFSQNFKGNIEIIVLDSSDDRTADLAKTFANRNKLRVVRVEPEDYNYGGTRNAGAAMAEGNFIVFISTDVVISERNWLKKLIRNLNDPEVAGVFGRQIPKKGASPMEEFFIQDTYPDHRREYSLKKEGKISDFFFSNTNSAIKREVWERVQLPIMLKSEDQKWAAIVLLAGYKIVYDPEAAVHHSHHYTLKKVFREYFDSGATMPFVYDDGRIRPANFFLRGLNFEARQLKYLCANNYLSHVPYAIVYDLMKFLGYFLGTKSKYMPIWMKKTLSRKSNHWNKYHNAF